MGGNPEPVQRVVAAFARLPGIGTRSAERLAWYLMKADKSEAAELAAAIVAMREALEPCGECFHVTGRNPCSLCSDRNRDRSTILVVESSRDLIAIEETGRYRGLYHVLMGHRSPHDGVRSEHITVAKLLDRVNRGGVREVILATNPDAEGDGTSLSLGRELRKRNVAVSRLARGLPAGFAIEYAGTEVLADALSERRPLPREEDEDGA